MFPCPILGKGSIGSPVQNWVKVVYVLKSNTGKRFQVPQCSTGKRLYRFPSPILGIGSRFPSSVLEKRFQVPQCSTGKMLYRFTSPILRKGSRFPFPVLEKGCGFPSTVLGKSSWFPSPILGKGSVGSPVQY